MSIRDPEKLKEILSDPKRLAKAFSRHTYGMLAWVDLFGDKLISGFTHKGQWHLFDSPLHTLQTRSFNIHGPMIIIHTLSLVNDGLKNRIKRKIQIRLERLYRKTLLGL